MSNLHSKQTGAQLHKPQKHAEAEHESFLIKTKDDTVGYFGCHNEYSTQITPTADVSGSLNNKYFCIYSKNMSQKYAVYFSVNNEGTLTLPSGYDVLIKISISTNETVANIIDLIVENFASVNASSNYPLYDSITDNTTNLVITQSLSPVVTDVNTGFIFDVTTTANNVDKVLINSSTNILKFKDLSETIADTVGAMVSGNTETNITVTYDDTDNTLDFEATGGGGNAFTTINCPSGTDPVADSSTDTLNLTAGTGISITGNSTTDTVTIASTQSFTNTAIISESVRFETNNLATETGAFYGFQGEHTTKGGLISIALDPTGFTQPTALRSTIYIRPNVSGTFTFNACSSIMTGTNSAAVTMSLYKASPCSSDSSYAGIFVASGNHSLTGNNNSQCVNWTLSSAEDNPLVLSAQDVLILLLSTEEAIEDLDCRGMLTWQIEKT